MDRFPGKVQWAYVALDCFMVILVGFVWFMLEVTGAPYHRGFYCTDESIKYPHLPNTVPTVSLSVVGVIVALLTVAICEVCNYKWRKSRVANWGVLVRVIYISLGLCLFGLGATMSLTNVAKFSIGRLRPNFLALCQPDISGITCTVNTGYLVDYKCLNTNEKELREAHLSFLSGHTSFSFFTAVFLAVYLYQAFPVRKSAILGPTIQLAYIILAFWVGYTRISDYWHHWSDVLAGAILGSALALITGVWMMKRTAAVISQTRQKEETTLHDVSIISTVND